jgi:hypothetical protein
MHFALHWQKLSVALKVSGTREAEDHEPYSHQRSQWPEPQQKCHRRISSFPFVY